MLVKFTELTNYRQQSCPAYLTRSGQYHYFSVHSNLVLVDAKLIHYHATILTINTELITNFTEFNDMITSITVSVHHTCVESYL